MGGLHSEGVIARLALHQSLINGDEFAMEATADLDVAQEAQTTHGLRVNIHYGRCKGADSHSTTPKVFVHGTAFSPDRL